MAKDMMKCGHSSNATRSEDGSPCCSICSPDTNAYILAETPDLSGRRAQCSCGCTVPSSTTLAFFEYRGTGSTRAVESCKCGYSIHAHQHDPRRVNARSVVERGECQGFQTRGGFEYDSFYCGHGGWD